MLSYLVNVDFNNDRHTHKSVKKKRPLVLIPSLTASADSSISKAKDSFHLYFNTKVLKQIFKTSVTDTWALNTYT